MGIIIKYLCIFPKLMFWCGLINTALLQQMAELTFYLLVFYFYTRYNKTIKHSEWVWLKKVCYAGSWMCVKVGYV